MSRRSVEDRNSSFVSERYSTRQQTVIICDSRETAGKVALTFAKQPVRSRRVWGCSISSAN